jgi:hypothetical protein
MYRRDISKALFAAAAGSTAVAQPAEAQTSAAPRYARTPAEIASGVTPVNDAYSPAPYDVRRAGALVDNSNNDTNPLSNAIFVASQTVNGAAGAVVSMPTGISVLGSTVTLPNRVRIVGQNERGSCFRAKSTWNSVTSPWVFHAVDGTSSMFGSTIEDLTVDCSNIAGLGCVLSDAWQENCGLRRTLLLNFGTYAVKFQNGYGGAAYCKLSDTEIFSGTIAGSTGIDVEQMSVSGATFILDLQNVTIAGGATMLKGVNMVAESLHCRTVHLETCTHGIYLNGNGNHTLIGVTGATTVTNLVTLDPMFNGTLTMLGCFRNGGTNLINDQRLQQIAQIGTITGGSGYKNGIYNQVPLTGGSGTGATAQIVVSGGAVTQVNMGVPGTRYAVGDTLSAAPASIGGKGRGFSVPVFQVFTGIGVLGGQDSAQIRILPATQSFGLSCTRSPTELMAWGTFDGTLTGTNAPQASQNVLSVQRTEAGRYLVTLANSASGIGMLIPFATCTNPSSICAAAPAGSASFTISINSTSLVGADSNEIFFLVAGR